MNRKSTFERIMTKTGKKPTSCTCLKCKSQCRMPCLGTPEDMIKLIGAGYQDRVVATNWNGGIQLGLTNRPIEILIPKYDNEKKSCTFFTETGLCELHDKGLKPTEGKLSHHSTTAENFNPKRSISWWVAKEWMNVSKKKFTELAEKYIRK